LGLKIGIYSSAGTMTCAHYAGSLGYEEKDAAVWASWGVCFASYLESRPCLRRNTDKSIDRLSQIRQLLQPRRGRHAQALI
jgi:alpha-galactosidase